MSNLFAYSSAFATRPSVSFGGFLSAIADTDDNVEARLAAAEAALARGEAELNEAVVFLTKLIQTAREEFSRGETGDCNPVIETAQTSEQMIKRDYEETLRLRDRLTKLLRRVDPEFLDLLEPSFRRYDEVVAQFIASIVDIRWQLMALRAEARKDETGPVFSDPRELRRHLTGARG
jgi:hypothetical protein